MECSANYAWILAYGSKRSTSFQGTQTSRKVYAENNKGSTRCVLLGRVVDGQELQEKQLFDHSVGNKELTIKDLICVCWYFDPGTCH